MEARRPDTWGVRDVGDWLASLELGLYRQKFETLSIDGMLLFEMTDQDLLNDLEMPVRLHRFKILENIKKLKERCIAVPIEAESEDSSQQQANARASLPEVEETKWEMLVLKAVEGQLLNNTFLIGSEGASIGRNSASNDIVVGESFVSRKHCEIRFKAQTNQFLLTDTGSTTGTFLMVRHPLELELGMMFQMGLSEFKVNNVKYNPYGKVISLELVIYEGPARQNTINVNSEGLTIGRDVANTYCIREDSQMSSFHGKISFEDGVFYLDDVRSTNRTWRRLSGESQRSEPYPLLVGDVIKIGSTVLVAQLPDSSQLPSSINLEKEPTEPVPEDAACKICFSRELNVACYPCGHMFCEVCVQKCNNCPICRKNIQDLIKLYK